MSGMVTYPSGIVSSELERVAAIRTQGLKMDALPDTLNALQLVRLFDPFVKTTQEDGSTSFALDEAATGLPVDDDYLTYVRVCVAVANALPPPARTATPAVSRVAVLAGGGRVLATATHTRTYVR